ncbi:DUF368 domain-containing protein [Naumannella huperziae]
MTSSARPLTPADRAGSSRPSLLGLLGNWLRGILIGMAELVPGVSGGTVALVVGCYDDLIGSAAKVVRGFVSLIRPPHGQTRGAAFRSELGDVRWSLVIPALIGMGTAIVALSGIMHGFVEDSPELSRALFAGMVLASLLVPISMLRSQTRAPGGAGRRVLEFAVVAAAAVALFLLLGLRDPARSATEPPLPLVFLAAAIAICALVVPGVSGSFLLLAMGLYAPTLAAVSDRNASYLGVFALGAIVGLATFVQVLSWLLREHRRWTLLVMLGLMAGSLRALWPWQGADGSFRAPGPDPWPAVGLFVLGVAVVLVLWLVERRMTPQPKPARAA